MNKSIESMEELGGAIKEIIQYMTIRGKFSSVHPDLAAEGITRVEVGEEGLHFIRNNDPAEDLEDLDEEEMLMRAIALSLEEEEEEEELFSIQDDSEMVAGMPGDEDEEEMLKRAIAMSLEEQQ